MNSVSPAARRRMNYAAVIAPAVALLLPACATAPVDQIKYFSQAFASVNTLGQPLLDDLAIAERRQGREIAVRRAQGKSQQGADKCPRDDFPWLEASDPKQGVILGFCLNDAAYYSELADPPATRMMRGSLSVIERYADLLSTLAEGRNVEGEIAEIEALSREVGGLFALAGVATPALAPVLGALHPILESAARQSSAQEARRLVLQGAPVVTRLIGALETAAPAMFRTLVEQTTVKLVSKADADPTVAAGDVARVEAYRVAVANYVVLLRKLQAAWDLTVQAASVPANQVSVATLVRQTSQLRADAENARRVFSILRSGLQ
ncbi:MAG TPA: hypothetical protein VHP37_24755 [Burkholderiales bacterium]|nr:hypothetical protein [Burkholderiales bacterium]